MVQGKRKATRRDAKQPKCEACQYARVKGLDRIKCHRYPGYEIKQLDEWCGEFKPQTTGERITE